MLVQSILINRLDSYIKFTGSGILFGTLIVHVRLLAQILRSKGRYRSDKYIRKRDGGHSIESWLSSASTSTDKEDSGHRRFLLHPETPLSNTKPPHLALSTFYLPTRNQPLDTISCLRNYRNQAPAKLERHLEICLSVSYF